MTFSTLERRLREHLRSRVGKGRMTESALARHLGVSQSFLFHVLRGAKRMSPETADAVMRRLGVELEDLVSATDLRPRGYREAPESRFMEVGVLKGRIAAGQPFPLEPAPTGSRAFTSEFLRRFTNPILVKVGPAETSMLPTIQPNDLLLLDQSPERRRLPRMTRIYALNLEEGGTVKRCELVGDELMIVPENMQERRFSPRTVPMRDRDILDIVKGEVVWIGREL